MKAQRSKKRTILALLKWGEGSSRCSIYFVQDCNHGPYGQYKIEQLSPIPPKQCWRSEESKKRAIWHHWNGGEVQYPPSRGVVEYWNVKPYFRPKVLIFHAIFQTEWGQTSVPHFRALTSVQWTQLTRSGSHLRIPSTKSISDRDVKIYALLQSKRARKPYSWGHIYL